MLKQKFSDFTERYGKFLRGFVDLHDNTPLHINFPRLHHPKSGRLPGRKFPLRFR